MSRPVARASRRLVAPRAVSMRSAVVALALGAGFACATQHAGLQVDPGPVSPAYADALRTHTRAAWRTDGFDRLVRMTATLQSPAFLEARIGEQARLLGVPPPEATEIRDDLPVVVEGTSVLLFIEALDRAWERLDRRDHVWTFHLEVGGARHAPSEIRRVEERDATVQHLFPFVSRFGRAWLLVFPVDDVGPEPALVVTGAPASLRLEFGGIRRDPRR